MKYEYTGTKEVDGNPVCAVCGNDSMKATMFADGLNFYIQQGNCKKCGNPISVKGTYEPGDEMYEEEEL